MALLIEDKTQPTDKKKNMTSNEATTDRNYITTEYADICTNLSMPTAEKFRTFAKNIYGLKMRAVSNPDKENLLIRITEAAKNYIVGSPAFESVSDKIKSDMEKYFSAILGVALPEKRTTPSVTSTSATTPTTKIIVPGYNDEDDDYGIIVSKPEDTQKTEDGFAIVNVILLKGACVLMCKKGEEWSLPSGNVRYGENPRVAAARHVSDTSRISIIENRLNYISSYETEGENPKLIINYMYAPKTKPSAISTSSVDKAEFIDFDKIFSLKLREGDEKILRTFIVR